MDDLHDYTVQFIDERNIVLLPVVCSCVRETIHNYNYIHYTWLSEIKRVIEIRKLTGKKLKRRAAMHFDLRCALNNLSDFLRATPAFLDFGSFLTSGYNILSLLLYFCFFYFFYFLLLVVAN